MTDDPVRLEVGRVGRAHGLRGEVHVVAVTQLDRAVRARVAAVRRRARRCVDRVGAAERERLGRAASTGVDDRNAAEALRGKIVRGRAARDAPDGELWVHEVIGAEVRDRAGAVLGRVEAVQANPAHDLLVLDTGALDPDGVRRRARSRASSWSICPTGCWTS